MTQIIDSKFSANFATKLWIQIWNLKVKRKEKENRE
jgi:hypothetical protein